MWVEETKTFRFAFLNMMRDKSSNNLPDKNHTNTDIGKETSKPKGKR